MEDLLQVSKVSIMNVRTIVVAVGFASVAGIACAAGQGKVMPAVSVSAVDVSACTPPNGVTGHACDSYDAFVRANFSSEQIRELFGCRSCSPGYLAGEHEYLQQRYDVLLQQYLTAHAAGTAATRIAAK